MLVIISYYCISAPLAVLSSFMPLLGENVSLHLYNYKFTSSSLVTFLDIYQLSLLLFSLSIYSFPSSFQWFLSIFVHNWLEKYTNHKKIFFLTNKEINVKIIPNIYLICTKIIKTTLFSHSFLQMAKHHEEK